MNIQSIKTEEEYKAALAAIEALWNAEPNTKRGEELSVLAILLENYESEKFQILPPDLGEAIKFRRENLGRLI